MADEVHGHDPKNCQEHVRFEWQTPDSADDDGLHIVAYYGEARLHLDFTDDGKAGTQELATVLGAMPVILKYIRNEVQVRRDMEGVEQDLLDLLGGSEEEK